jgi:hypothetical protein
LVNEGLVLGGSAICCSGPLLRPFLDPETLAYNDKKARSFDLLMSQSGSRSRPRASELLMGQAYNVWIDVHVNASASFLFHTIRSFRS